MTATSKGFASALRSATPVQHARISGIGGYRPKRIVPNSEIVERIDSSDEWIRERSGIIERRWAGDGRVGHRHVDLRRRAGARDGRCRRAPTSTRSSSRP